ncbi:MAG: glutaredoxin family protein [Desulfovibrionaceae bacterium]|nr:glutaredoxin family protein [Desulfovibrionaceae bacterium]
MEWAFGVLAAAVVLGGAVSWWRAATAGNRAAGPDGGPETPAAAYELGMRPGADGRSVMYTLHTCRHCVRLKEFLDARAIPCHLVYVDDFRGAKRRAMVEKVRSLNPRGSFPTLVLPDGRVLVGFRERAVREAYGLPESDDPALPGGSPGAL